jgi:hypothetical protein
VAPAEGVVVGADDGPEVEPAVGVIVGADVGP